MKRLAILVALVGLVTASPATAAFQTRLDIPKLGIDTTTTQTLSTGPMVYWHTPYLTAIAGHRTTHTHPFYNLNELKYGDKIFVGKHEYRVVRQYQIRPWQLWIYNLRGLVLSACTPRGSDAFRLIVHATLVR